MKWISVEDRLPESGFSHCLFYSKLEKLYSVGGIYGGIIQSNDDELFHNNISHWMPLPEPPE